LTRYEVEISRLRAQLETLKSDRGKLQGYYDACSSLLSPIRRVPSEILVDIFARARPVSRQAEIRLGKTNSFPLSWVCLRWYDIVLGTPTLWDTI
ncbi:hypothetical protein B0H11DRAFT_1696169, partial [Mycena galericulata]